MRLLCTFAAIIALSLAESEQNYDDLVAMETMELKKTRDLKPEASVYSSFNNWNVPNKDNNFNIPNKDNNWNLPNNNFIQPPYVPPTWNPPQNPVNYFPSATPGPFPPVSGGPITLPPVNYPPYIPSATPSPVQSDYIPLQNNYYPQQTWSTPNYHQSTTTTPIPVIKNDQFFGENGSYKYEYQIGDGTHVGEEGYFTDPKGDEESLVKKGWYSYQGADGRQYTVTYWADKTGFHAYGDHLPTPPTPHPAIQEAIDKENAATNKPQTIPQQQPQPQNPSNNYYPSQQTNYPSQQTNYPSQQTNYPSQQTNYPSQQTNYPSQQTNYPSQQTNYPSQQTYYPPQQTYYPPQQSGYGK